MMSRVTPRVTPGTNPIGLTSTRDSNEITPSEYLEKLKTLITDKQKELSGSAIEMQKSVEKLESNVELMKQKIASLETAKSTLADELKKSEMDGSPESNAKIAELQQEKSRIQQELNKNLDLVSKLESSIQMKEDEWNKRKSDLVQKLKVFENQQLIPYLKSIEDTMKLTNAKIEASNVKLTKYMSGEMEFGNDVFVNIGKNLQEKYINNAQLFQDMNNFGASCSMEYGDEHDDAEHDDEQHDAEHDDTEHDAEHDDTEHDAEHEMKFGKNCGMEYGDLDDDELEMEFGKPTNKGDDIIDEEFEVDEIDVLSDSDGEISDLDTEESESED